MIVVRRSVYRDSERVQEEMERVFRSMMPVRPKVANGASGLWRPPIEVYETVEGLVVNVEIAGMDEHQLNVVIDGNRLLIRGERPDHGQAEKRSYHEARIQYGAFGADLVIPFPVDADRAEADYHNGFLRIVLPRPIPRTIVPRRIDQASK
ncbi:MAG TPA: Hsp20/alpha crystallin family protein [Thermomicrobiales bacterium]|nr:Hsp20/alpha crystallin family protein [Thermomicrobiales bacterium]